MGRIQSAFDSSTATRVDFGAVKAASLGSIDMLLDRWLPGGRRNGNEYVVRNPTRADGKPGSFSVNRRTGVWSDFATGDKGGDMIDLYRFLHGGTPLDAARAVGDLLGVAEIPGTASIHTFPKAQRASTVMLVADVQRNPEILPLRDPPGPDRPKFFVAGDEGTRRYDDEKRRHAYLRGTKPVKYKIMRKVQNDQDRDRSALIYFRVVDVDGTEGWQSRKPDGWLDIPFIGGVDPFAPDNLGMTVHWPEGEKDVETLADRGFAAFAFGGTGDGLPAGCEEYVRGRDVVILADNDAGGIKHAEDKATLAAPIAASVRVLHFPELATKQDVSDWFEQGGTAEKLREKVTATPAYERPKASTGTDSHPSLAEGEKPAIEVFWHGKKYDRPLRSWLVQDLIPETGSGIGAGQWGGGKTFGMLDLAASLVTGTPFAGRDVCRQGGVLFIAAEGASEIPIRLEGVVEHKLRPNALAAAASGAPVPAHLDGLPLAWIEECPDLKDRANFGRIVALAKATGQQIKERFDLPLALIVIDTYSASANIEDHNSSSEGQFMFNLFNELSRATGAFVLVVDHFGKAVETGTRGTSAKEGAADMVLAFLADREISGGVSNTRMAIRKLRGGVTGIEIPFDLKVVDLGENGTTCVIEWRPEVSTAPKKETGKKDRWPQSLRVFRASALAAMVSSGKDMRPFGSEGPVVRAVPEADVRAEFTARYPADSETKGDAKRKAYSRALKQAVEKDLACSREIAGIDWVWLPDGKETLATTPDGQDT